MRTALAVALFAAALVAASLWAQPAAAGGGCNGGSPSIDGEEAAFLRLINDHRESNGVESLAVSTTLNRAAAWKAEHMAANTYFDHADPSGRGFVDRLRDCGYTANTWLGENIAAGMETAEATFQQWRQSPGHNDNMLNPNFTAIGIGRAFNPDSPYGWYWTTDFGGQRDQPAPPPASSPDRSGDANCTSLTDSVDAALVLQFDARLIGSLPCEDEADVNGDGAINALDATLILQLAAGLIG